jgi:hypothetical protein
MFKNQVKACTSNQIYEQIVSLAAKEAVAPGTKRYIYWAASES